MAYRLRKDVKLVWNLLYQMGNPDATWIPQRYNTNLVLSRKLPLEDGLIQTIDWYRRQQGDLSTDDN